jgi:hypothetical protein
VYGTIGQVRTECLSLDKSLPPRAGLTFYVIFRILLTRIQLKIHQELIMKSFNAIETFGYHIPKVHKEFLDCWKRDDLKTIYLESYESGKQSFVPVLLPEIAVQLHTSETLAILRKRLGSKLDVALDPKYTNPDNIPETLPEEITSPVIDEPNGNWLKLCNMVGINVRTCGCPRPDDKINGNKAFGSFWNIVKYALTLPEAVDSIHILPIWEAGVVGSIYGISSWTISPEHYSKELEQSYPHLNTPGKQLRAVINILHAMGRTVGMDVIPHTDRFSQMVFTHPHYYEWLQRQDAIIIDHSDNLYQEVQAKIFEFIQFQGSAVEEETIPETYEDFIPIHIQKNSGSEFCSANMKILKDGKTGAINWLNIYIHLAWNLFPEQWPPRFGASK